MQRPRDLAVALSLANLCYLRVWSELLTYTRANTYLMKTPPVPAEYAAAMTNVLLAGALFWGLTTMTRRFLPKGAFGFVEMGFLVTLAVPLNALRSVLANDFSYLRSPLFEVIGTRGVAALAGALGLGGLTVVVFFHHRAARVAAAGLAIASPFCAITFGQAIWKAAHYDDRAYADKPSAAPVAGVKRFPRVVWFICDEWDYRLTFIDRDRTLALPEIDRLRREAVYAENAFPPGPETPVSIPGYYTGRLVSAVEYQNPRQLGVKFQGESGLLPWSEQPNYFGRARDLGFNTALVEWFHPTCRVLDGLTFCRWWEMAMQHNSMGKDFGRILRNQARSLFESNLFSLFGRALTHDQQTATYGAILRAGEAVVNQTDYGFTVVHLPIPHAPNAYDRRTGTFTLGNSPIRGYLDSLALLDRTIGEVRRSMENAGTWEKTTVLFTSDHPYREAESLDGKSDPRIPYLLKMASQNGGGVYAPPFNAVLTGDLLLAVLRGEVGSAAEVAAWLDRNRGRFPTH
jgi:sulfatase-like protein